MNWNGRSFANWLASGQAGGVPLEKLSNENRRRQTGSVANQIAARRRVEKRPIERTETQAAARRLRQLQRKWEG